MAEGKKKSGKGKGMVPKGMVTREHIKEKLESLKRAPPPQRLSPGAMCYMPAFNDNYPVRAYVCPVCLKRTLYGISGQTENGRQGRFGANPYRDTDFDIYGLVEGEIKIMREIGAGLKKHWGFEFDESSLCIHCSPDANVVAPVLVVKLDGKEAHRVVGISREDMLLIWEFGTGKLTHHGHHDEEVPLKTFAPRLRELLLGVVEPESKGKDGDGEPPLD